MVMIVTARAALAVSFALIFLIMATDGAPPSSNSLGGSSTLRDSSIKQRTDADSIPESMRGAGTVVVRFYLIRHGQTDANIQGLVLGQTDSVRI